MSRQDPGAATGTGVYPPMVDCSNDDCGHSEALHTYGRRDGRMTRTWCSRSDCDCRLFRKPS